MAFAPHSMSPAELKAMLEVERDREPFLAYREALGELRFTRLSGRDRLAIGRVAGNDLVLDWDPQVSRSHAQLERIGSDWTITDEGLSRNGSHVNGERLVSRRRLSDGDVVRIGRTTLLYRSPGGGFESTAAANSAVRVALTAAERRVLVALCAPFAADTGPAPVPASNREVAEALHVSVESVRTHVKSLFNKLGVGDLPQYQKRTELARRALEHGLVTRADFSG